MDYCCSGLTVYFFQKSKKRSDFIHHNSINTSFKASDSWVILNPIEQSIKRKIESVGVPLKDWDISIYRGVLTGCNEAFIISDEKRKEILDNCKNDEEKKRTAELIRPILRGRDIKRYEYNFDDLYLINTHNGIKEKNIPRIDIKEYPEIKKHLDEYWDKIGKRVDKGDTPYNLRNCAYLDDFSMQKVMYNDISKQLSFCLVPKDIFCVNTVYFIKNNCHLKYLLAYLNTKIVNWYYRTISVQLGEKAVRMFSIYMMKLPAPVVSKDVEKQISELVDKRISSAEFKCNQFEQEIESYFYKAFDFTEEEIDHIESL